MFAPAGPLPDALEPEDSPGFDFADQKPKSKSLIHDLAVWKLDSTVSHPNVGLRNLNFGVLIPNVGVPKPDVEVPKPDVGVLIPEVGDPKPDAEVSNSDVGDQNPDAGEESRARQRFQRKPGTIPGPGGRPFVY